MGFVRYLPHPPILRKEHRKFLSETGVDTEQIVLDEVFGDMRTERLVETVDLDEFPLEDRDHERMIARQQEMIDKRKKLQNDRQRIFRKNKLQFATPYVIPVSKGETEQAKSKSILSPRRMNSQGSPGL